jgi:hypothetical protein
MAQSGSGFDISKMSMGSKILAGGGILLLIFSFFAWQKYCVLDIACVNRSMWNGDGAIFGFLGGLALLALIAWEVMQVLGAADNIKTGQPVSKISAYLGFAVAALTILKFVFAVGNFSAFGAYVGLVLALVIAYGAWMRFQEPVVTAPADGGIA